MYISILLFVQLCMCNLILTPKKIYHELINYNSFNKEHNIEQIVEIEDLVIYKSSITNYNLYKDTINELFNIEEEQSYTASVHNFKVEFKKINQMSKFTDELYKLKKYLFNDIQSDIQFESPVPWHLDRITKRNLPLNGSYIYSKNGSCHTNSNVEIHTVIVDTGIDIKHPEFEGRAVFLENFTDDKQNYDGNSHGTHCGGIVGSKTYGVCKDAKLFAVKVLDSKGSGSTSGVLAGMNYVYNRHVLLSKTNNKIRTIMSMSLGGGYSSAMNKMIEKMISGSNTFYVSVASGNENQDACKTSPASAKGVFSVMASGIDDKRAYFSNKGLCTDIYTPGVNIESTIPNSKTAVYSGTSMAAPNLAGVMNHYLDQFPNLNMKQLKDRILSDTSKDVIKDNPTLTNNLFVYLHR